MYVSTKRLDLLISFSAASRLRITQSFGLGFLFVPISLAAYIGIPPEKGNNVSGMVNFMRNIGSSVGTSAVTTLLARRAQSHQLLISYHATNYDPPFRDQVNGLAAQLVHSGASIADARIGALNRAYQEVLIQAQTLAYIDTFMILAIAAGIMFMLSFLIRSNDPAPGRVVLE
jgi:DHA2 family multidrug resistance protein